MMRPTPGCGVRRSGRGGFTFVEILAALFFLALVVPALLSGLTLANRTAVMAERRAIAGELAENKLNEALLNDGTGLGANTRGDFGPERPGYRWELSSSAWAADTSIKMTELTEEVFFTVQGREYSVRLSTLANQLNTGSQTTTP